MFTSIHIRTIHRAVQFHLHMVLMQIYSRHNLNRPSNNRIRHTMKRRLIRTSPLILNRRMVLRRQRIRTRRIHTHQVRRVHFHRQLNRVSSNRHRAHHKTRFKTHISSLISRPILLVRSVHMNRAPIHKRGTKFCRQLMAHMLNFHIRTHTPRTSFRRRIITQVHTNNLSIRPRRNFNFPNRTVSSGSSFVDPGTTDTSISIFP